jgi:hypothetical protein
MQDNHSYAEILTMLQAGVSPEEIAKDFTDTLNAAEADFKKITMEAKLHGQIQDLTHEINALLENWNKFYGNEKSCAKFFTADEIKGILNAKIQGKNLNVNLNVVADTAAQKKMTLQDFVDNMSEEELEQAWKDSLNGLIQLFSK